MNAGILFIGACLASGIAAIIIAVFHFTRRSAYQELAKALADMAKGNLARRALGRNMTGFAGRLATLVNDTVSLCQDRLIEQDHRLAEHRLRVAGIAHDLRTPLAAIMGYAEALASDVNLTEDERRLYLSIIRSRSAGLSELVEDFFTLSSLRLRSAPEAFERVDICETLRQAVLSFYRQMQDRGLEPVMEIPDGEIPVLADRGCVTRVIENLVGNSLRHAGDVTQMGLRVVLLPDRVTCEVWDNGSRLLPEQLSGLFEEPASGNRGLGLVIVGELVRSMGGKVNASRTDDRTTVSFTLRRPKKE